MKLLRIKLPDQLHARLKVQCAMEQRSMQDCAASLLTMWSEGRKLVYGDAKINPALASANPQKSGVDRRGV